MRSPRSLICTVALLFAAAGLAVVGTASPAVAASHYLEMCGPGVPKPCITAFTRNGSAAGAPYVVEGIAVDDPGFGRSMAVNVRVDGGDHGGYDLGSAARSDVFSVTLDMGSWSPSIVVGKGRDAEVARSGGGSSYQVTLTARPVLLSGQCDQSTTPWRCPEADVVTSPGANNVQWESMWAMEVYDGGFLDDAAVRSAIYGLEYFHNFAASAIPPGVVFDDDDVASLVIDIANRRFLEDGTTLVVGHAEMRIPNAFLRTAYGVPNPATMTGSSLRVNGSGSGATTSIAQESATDSMRVLVDGVTFPDIGVADGELRQGSRAAASSMKTLKIKRGVIKPTKVKVAKTKRVSAFKGKVKAQKAKARGAKVKGYQAKCTWGKTTVTGKSKKRTVVVKGLRRNRVYQCKVRALSKAGPASYSKKKRLKARP